MFDVSIIVPVYNVEEFITQCVKSVISQTFCGTMECIIVDDCSPDRSCDIVSDILSSYTGNISFRILHHDKNGGLSAARNTGIREAKGKYIYFLDSDDYIIPECIEVLWNTAQKYSKADFIQAGTIVDFDMQNIEKMQDLPCYSDDIIWIRTKYYDYTSFFVTAWNRLIRRDFILQNNLYFKEGIYHEDVHWLLYALKYVQSVAFCKKNTYYYNVRPGSIMDQSSIDLRRVDSWISISEDYIDDIDDICKDYQVSLLFKKILHLYYSLKCVPDSQRTRIKNNLLRLKQYCSLKQKILLSLVLCLPVSVNQYKVVYFAIDGLFSKYGSKKK